MTSASSFLLSLSTYFVVFCLLFLFYLLLCRFPSNAVVFFSGRLLRGHAPPVATETTWKLLEDSVRTTEDEIVQLAGLDAATYTKMHTLCLKILLWASLYCIPVLLPVNWFGHLYDSETGKTLDTIFVNLDKFSLGNIQPKSDALWAHAIGAWWLSLGTFYILYTTFRDFTKLRAHAQLNDIPEPSQLAVLVRDIPKPKARSTPKELIDGVFGRAHGKAYLGSVLLPKMDYALAKWTELQTAKRQLSHARALYELSKTESNPSGTRPSHKTGFFSLFGPETDSIECYKDKVKELVHQLRGEQLKLEKDEHVPAAIVLFKRRETATSASEGIATHRADRWHVMAAPEPQDLVWENVTKFLLERQIRTLVIYVVVALTILFYMIPISFIAGLTTLSNLEKTLPFVKSFTEDSALKTILEAFLPQLFLIIFLSVLPYLLWYLSYLQGLPSKSQILRASTGKYYYFIVINVFLGVSLSGGVYAALQQIIESPKQVAQLLGGSIPAQSTFFITYIALSIFLGQGLQISQIVRYVLYRVQLRYFCKTEEELRDAWNPGSVPYNTSIPNDLLAITLGLCYALISPAILPFNLLYHAITWGVMKHQSINVYHDEYQSGGRMFPQIHTRMVVALMVAQLTIIGYLGLKGFVGSVSLIPLPILTILYFQFTRARFYKSFKFNSLDMGTEAHSTESIVDFEELERLYTPPCLKKDDGESDFLSAPLIGNVRQMAISGIRSEGTYM